MVMDMYQKRIDRKNHTQEQNQSKMNINWFPGHMKKTKRLIEEKYDSIDLVYEIIDARIPFSSKIKDIDNLIKNKPKILIMTKKDLCDLEETNKWIKYYEDLCYKVILLNSNDKNDYNKLVNLTLELMKEKIERKKEKGLINNQIRVLVVGIPNVGKSTIINKMAGRKVCNVENKPGVTKNLNWIKTSNNILLLDTPGILWPKFDTEEIGLNLVSMTAIKESVAPLESVAIHVLNKLNDYYPNILKDRFNIDKFSSDMLENYEIIGKKIGAIKNNEVNQDRVTNYIINEIKNEKIRGITFDRRD